MHECIHLGHYQILAASSIWFWLNLEKGCYAENAGQVHKCFTLNRKFVIMPICHAMRPTPISVQFLNLNCYVKIKYLINWLALCNRAACFIRASACNAAGIRFDSDVTTTAHWHWRKTVKWNMRHLPLMQRAATVSYWVRSYNGFGCSN